MVPSERDAESLLLTSVDQVALASRKSACAAREWKIVEAVPGFAGNRRPLWNLQIALLCLMASRRAFLAQVQACSGMFYL